MLKKMPISKKNTIKNEAHYQYGQVLIESISGDKKYQTYFYVVKNGV